MRKATPFLATVLSCLLAASAAHAQSKKPSSRAQQTTVKQTYKWTDDQGVVHYGDSVPSEYSQREQRVLNSQGLEVQKHQAEMTPAEAAEYAAKQKEESRRKQHDMFLISTYPSVKEIENVRDIRLEQIKGQITAAEAYISSLTTRVDELKKRAQNFAPYSSKPNARRMPDDLAQEMVRVMSELRTQNSALNIKREEHQRVVAQYDDDIKRFKELRTSAAARVNQANSPKQ
jgi:chromosome segregation ATPase